MRSEILDVGTFRSRSDNVPDGFWCKALAPDLSLSADSPKDCTLIDLSCFGPLINGELRECASPYQLGRQSLDAACDAPNW